MRDNVKYREELVGKGPTFEPGDLVKIRYQVYKGNGDYMFSTGYGREFQDDVGGEGGREGREGGRHAGVRRGVGLLFLVDSITFL